MRLMLLALACLLVGAPAAAQTGRATVVDGDTIRLGDVRVRLWGIDAPERHQVCTTAAGKPWRCGEAPTAALRGLVGNRTVSCTQRTTDRYQRPVAVCTVNGADVGAAMVRQGMALAFRRYSGDYVAIEDDARTRRAGIWSGAFDDPAAWR